jgi:hypothetical protein
MAGVTGQVRGKRRTTPQDDLYCAIRAALIEKFALYNDQLFDASQVSRNEAAILALVNRRYGIEAALETISRVKGQWTRQQRKGGR